MEYRYGMRLRGFSPGCQPMAGLFGCEDGGKKYHDILVYKRPLTAKEIEDYELDDLNPSTSRRELNMIVRPAGGTAGKGSYSCKITIPSAWAWDMGFSVDNRAAVVEYDPERKCIIIRKQG